MDQVVRMIQERTGIEEPKARKAAETVVGFLKDKLPGPVAGQLDGVLQGGDEGGESSPMDHAKNIAGDQRGNPFA